MNKFFVVLGAVIGLLGLILQAFHFFSLAAAVECLIVAIFCAVVLAPAFA